MRRCGGLCGRPGYVRMPGERGTDGGGGRTWDVTVKGPKRIGFGSGGGIFVDGCW